jgi:hypothetical protein
VSEEESDWLVTPERSAEELAKVRAGAVDFVRDYERSNGFPLTLYPEGKFTCDGCRAAPRCSLAFDPYNTDGDCLAGK